MMELERLKRPFPIDRIHWRVGSTNSDKSKGIGLAYLDARDVMERLDEVCGMGGWQCDYPWSDGKKVVCRIGIKIGDEWVWKANGAGDTHVEQDKGALSDAFKRAAVLWGVGQYLYSLPNKWVPLIAKGRTHVFTDPALKDLNDSMKAFLAPQRKELFDQYYAKHRTAVDAMLDAIEAQNYAAACEYWDSVPQEAQMFLQLSITDGGILDQKVKQVMKSSQFRRNAA